MFARETLPNAHKDTLCVPIYVSGEVTSKNRQLSPQVYGLAGQICWYSQSLDV